MYRRIMKMNAIPEYEPALFKQLETRNNLLMLHN